MPVVLDTSALLFYTLAPERLTSTAQAAIAGADKLIVSSISFWEIGLKAKRGRLTLPMSLAEFVHLISSLDAFEIVSVDVQTWLENVALDWDHRDPADRTIVATAKRRSSLLVTSDATIRAFYEQAIWS